MFSRAMPIIAPGMFLSQPPVARMPSRLWPLQTVSMESAITSRETSEYFMPSVPMEMPSEMVMVPKLTGIAPAARSASLARSAWAPMPMLQGVMVLWALPTPTMGFAKSSSVKPAARIIARLGVRARPSVTARLRRLSAMVIP